MTADDNDQAINTLRRWLRKIRNGRVLDYGNWGHYYNKTQVAIDELMHERDKLTSDLEKLARVESDFKASLAKGELAEYAAYRAAKAEEEAAFKAFASLPGSAKRDTLTAAWDAKYNVVRQTAWWYKLRAAGQARAADWETERPQREAKRAARKGCAAVREAQHAYDDPLAVSTSAAKLAAHRQAARRGTRPSGDEA